MDHEGNLEVAARADIGVSPQVLSGQTPEAVSSRLIQVSRNALDGKAAEPVSPTSIQASPQASPQSSSQALDRRSPQASPLTSIQAFNQLPLQGAPQTASQEAPQTASQAASQASPTTPTAVYQFERVVRKGELVLLRPFHLDVASRRCWKDGDESEEAMVGLFIHEVFCLRKWRKRDCYLGFESVEVPDIVGSGPSLSVELRMYSLWRE